jgi:hypothetical protein
MTKQSRKTLVGFLCVLGALIALVVAPRSRAGEAPSKEVEFRLPFDRPLTVMERSEGATGFLAVMIEYDWDGGIEQVAREFSLAETSDGWVVARAEKGSVFYEAGLRVGDRVTVDYLRGLFGRRSPERFKEFLAFWRRFAR